MYEVGTYKYLSPTKFAVWYRYNGSEKMPEGKTVIYGHTPTLGAGLGNRRGRLLHEEGKICIDCGAAYPERGGRLGCLRLEDMKEYYVGDGGQDA